MTMALARIRGPMNFRETMPRGEQFENAARIGDKAPLAWRGRSNGPLKRVRNG
ncbi:hypothetical protein [Paraburkholderia silvatlantica]|uniref:hypothetical protein n=1 Tax=Paraburkholderia silvatlantica TaxID=321895 RepID=UPI0015E8E191|nr:hypothetical protein [Paraburkholderia silvatlantica]